MLASNASRPSGPLLREAAMRCELAQLAPYSLTPRTVRAAKHTLENRLTPEHYWRIDVITAIL